jgi:hypothetical protein
MARQSLESAKVVLNALMLEQARDREALQGLMSHCTKMIETLDSMREQEEARIESEAAERKAAARKIFGDLIAVEEDRRERLSKHISDIAGEAAVGDESAADGHNSEKASPEELTGGSE